MSRWISLVFALCYSFALTAQPATRTYAGGYSTNWKTVGKHGHDAPCTDPRAGSNPEGNVEFCDQADFGRGNLDNSIGFRGGYERDFVSWHRLRFVGGLDGTVSDTEYNFSQRDLAIFAAAATAGVDYTAWGARLGVRYGVGPFLTTDFQAGVHSFKEIAITVPLSNASSVRFLRRTAVNSAGIMNGVKLAGSGNDNDAAVAKEFGLLVVSRPGDNSLARWAFAATSGMSSPGKFIGGDLHLSRAGFHRLTAMRDLGKTPRLQAQVTWSSFAHESRIEGVFNGYPKNLRSKTVDSYGISLRTNQKVWRGLSVFATAGGEMADWGDDHGLLLRGDWGNYQAVKAGLEGGANASVGVRYIIGRGMGVELMGEQAYWPRIGLSERRAGISFVIAR